MPVFLKILHPHCHRSYVYTIVCCVLKCAVCAVEWLDLIHDDEICFHTVIYSFDYVKSLVCMLLDTASFFVIISRKLSWYHVVAVIWVTFLIIERQVSWFSILSCVVVDSVSENSPSPQFRSAASLRTLVTSPVILGLIYTVRLSRIRQTYDMI